jgi:hypothetical protein
MFGRVGVRWRAGSCESRDVDEGGSGRSGSEASWRESDEEVDYEESEDGKSSQEETNLHFELPSKQLPNDDSPTPKSENTNLTHEDEIWSSCNSLIPLFAKIISFSFLPWIILFCYFDLWGRMGIVILSLMIMWMSVLLSKKFQMFVLSTNLICSSVMLTLCVILSCTGKEKNSLFHSPFHPLTLFPFISHNILTIQSHISNTSLTHIYYFKSNTFDVT